MLLRSPCNPGASFMTPTVQLNLAEEASVQVEVRKAARSVTKNKKTSLNRRWAASTPAWLAKYSAKIVQTAAEQDGEKLPAEVMQAVSDAVCAATLRCLGAHWLPSIVQLL